MGKDTEEIKRWKEVKEIEEEEEIDSIANQDRRVVDMSKKIVYNQYEVPNVDGYG